MNDFENQLATLLNERVDAKIGTREIPRFAGPGTVRPIGSGRRRAPWVLPLLAAACVAAIVGGSVGAAHLFAGKHHTVPPATQVPTVKPTPTPHEQSGLVTLDGATLPLPAGWVARDYVRYDPGAGHGATTDPNEGWCLTPASTPVKVGGCPIWFRGYHNPSVEHGPLMDVDNRGGSYGDPHQVCIPSGVTSTDLEGGEFSFGARTADYRHWTYHCASGPAFVAEQYVVATRPAYIIFSEHVDATVHQVMSDLAAHAGLPPSATVMRYSDFGYVRHIATVPGGVRLSIDRITHGIAADSDHTTYDYVVPNKVYAAANGVRVGKLALIDTDGSRVIFLQTYSR